MDTLSNKLARLHMKIRGLGREREKWISSNRGKNNAIRTNHIKVRIDRTQQNNRSRLCGDRDETINHIISECSKLAQKEYKTRHDWVVKGIHWELCKRLNFDQTNKLYMHKTESVPRMRRMKLSGTLRYNGFT